MKFKPTAYSESVTGIVFLANYGCEEVLGVTTGMSNWWYVKKHSTTIRKIGFDHDVMPKTAIDVGEAYIKTDAYFAKKK